MINNNRIVPVQATDLISLYSTILAAASVTLTKVSASGIGEFNVTSASTALICDEPVKSLNIAEAVTAATIYFVADYDFEGFSLNGTAAAVEGVVKDGRTLQCATLATGVITVAKVGM